MKRYISEIFDNLSLGAAKVFAGHSFETEVDEVTKRRLYNSVMSEIKAKNSASKKAKRKFRKTTIAIAAVIAALMVSLGTAAGAATLYKSFTDYKPDYTEEQKAAIDEARFPINEQTAFDGVSFTVTEGMRDDRMLYLMINVECDPDVVGSTKDKVISISSELHLEGDPLDDGLVAASVCSETLAHEGDTYTVLIGYDASAINDGQNLSLSFGGMSLYIPSKNSETGKEDYRKDLWSVSRHNDPASLTFTVSGPKANFGKQFYTDNKIPFMAHETDIDLGYISPWYGEFSLYSKGDDYDAFDIERSTPDVKIIMNDGKVYTTDNGINISNNFCVQSGTNKHEGAYVCRWDFAMTFNEYIDTVNIESIEINGVKVGIEDIDLNKKFAALDYYWSQNY